MCVCECIKELLKNVETGYCPNFFNPDAKNIFEGRLTEMNRFKLRDVLRWLLASELKVPVESENSRARR